ncbi:hypothetical protein JKF63_06601 [Porcisia hertigi]|uniref:Uncharacterized protein n=1 Tax=Porcisia hertigi TaxID=2761500 RepID=A0A836LEL7_9TRYP|nr:hypothetical protein JKF63_06601 [Porcisia hertigi]
MGYDSCATCCAVFSLLGIVHLVLFGRMFSEKAISFAIMAVENGWDRDKKAKACYNGAIIYTATLFLSVLTRVYFRRNDAAKAALLHAQHVSELQALLVPPVLMSTGSSQGR